MENKALKTVEKYNMLSYGDKIVIGLSGGADSSALFHFLVSLREKYGLTIIACHVNHMLRGAEADRDESFVRSLCESEGVEFKLLRVDVAAIAQRNKESTEKCGRDIRYAFFDEIASSCGGKIATAHTASDNAETVLFNMTRGCGIKGLCGIPPVRDNIIRPLIEVTRSEIEEYCNRNGLKYVDDSTNFTREYTRNKLRLDVVKVLKEINPSFEATVSAMSDRMRIQAEHLDSIARSIMNDAYTDKGYKANLLYSADEAVFSEVIDRLLPNDYPALLDANYNYIARDGLGSEPYLRLAALGMIYEKSSDPPYIPYGTGDNAGIFFNSSTFDRAYRNEKVYKRTDFGNKFVRIIEGKEK